MIAAVAFLMASGQALPSLESCTAIMANHGAMAALDAGCNAVFPKTVAPKVPFVGMSRDEAEHITWGRPTDKRRFETAAGVSEVWSFAGNRYLYLSDRTVIAISQ